MEHDWLASGSCSTFEVQGLGEETLAEEGGYIRMPVCKAVATGYRYLTDLYTP